MSARWAINTGVLYPHTEPSKRVVGQGNSTHYLKETQGGSEEDGPGWGCSRSSTKEPQYYSLKSCNLRLGKLLHDAAFHSFSTGLPPIFWILQFKPQQP
jgi:hypothetical protein